MLQLNKNSLLATLECNGVETIECSRCSDSWSIEYIANNLEDFQVIKVDYHGYAKSTQTLTFVNKEHFKKENND